MPAPRPLKRLLPVVLAALVGLLAISGQAGAQTPGAPTITSVTAGDGSLAVAWTAPGNQGGSTITSYDLRRIETDADETVDANWTVETGVWSSGTLSGTLEYTVDGLDGDVSYDVQVRAVNGEGFGEWSITSAGRPLIGVPTIDSVIVGDGALTISWSEPPHAAKVTIASYDLRYIETSVDETVESNWTVEETVWTRGSRIHVLEGLTNGTGYDVQVRAVASTSADWSATSTGTPVEHGDTRADATTVALGTRIGGMIDPGSDADYFKLVLNRSTGILVFTGGDLDTYGELLKRDGSLITDNDDGYLSLGIRNFLIWDSLSAGTYYLKVTSFGTATGAYVLFASGIADTTGSSNAQTMALGDHRNGLADPRADEDWFTFTLTEETDVAVRGSAAIDGELQDAGGQAVAGVVSLGLPSTGFALLATLAPGKYYLKVTPWDRLYTGLYSVYVLEAVEPGSTLATAVPLRFGRMAVGTIDPSNDTDYFRIDLDETAHVMLWARGEKVRVHGELQDDSGNTVDGAVLNPVFAGPVGFQLLDQLSAGTHYIKVTGSSNLGIGPDTGRYALLMSEDVLYTDFTDHCERVATTLSDPLAGCQWHLINSGQRKGADGEDINVEDAWATTLGSGINVAVVDDGMQHKHRDLRENVDMYRNHDYTGGDDIYDVARSHGTGVAGVIAARDNGIGVRGVAPRATIYGYNYLRKQSDLNESGAMTLHMGVTAVSNNSWGPRDNPLVGRSSELWERAVNSGVTDGYANKGVFYVFAAGNGGEDGDYSTLDEYANYYAVTAACAVNALGKRTHYSEMGANLWVCAPSSDRDQAGITTTANFHRYTGGFGGTSAAAPQVSGVAALVRSVENSLSWRDVKLILAASARKNDADDAGWETGALTYGSTTQRYQFNHEYGFGVVNAKAAVDLAGDWHNLPPMRTAGPVDSMRGVTVPISGTWVSSSISVESDIDFTEFVEVNAGFNATDFRDLRVELVSPSGAVSVLSVPESGNCPYRRPFSSLVQDCTLVEGFRFGSARHLGEDSSGTWTLRMADLLRGGPSNRLESWSITVYGHQSTPDAPALDYVDPGTSVDTGTKFLTVSWTPSSNTGTSAITGYDVRHIRSSASNKANDSAWTVIAGAGSRSYTIDMLDDGLRRDVQVRAVNDSGAGPWSVTGRGTPGATNSEPFFAEGLQATRTVSEDAGAGQSIGLPFTAKEADSDTFTFTLGGRDAALFEIDSSSGQLRVKDPLDHENKDSHRVTVSVRDSKDASGNADTADDATIAVTVMVEDVNESPELIGDTNISYLENGIDEVIEFTAEDPEGSAVTWGFSGTDQGVFTFDTGKLHFRSSPDREMPTDHGQDNTYDVVVTVSDGAQSADVPVTVTVTDDNEPFELEGDTAFDYDENGTRRVGVFSVVDDPENGPIVWERSGTDRGGFTIYGGVLDFAAVPDHENAADSNRDNRYHVTVTAYDGPKGESNQKSLSVTVTVADLDEPGTVTLPSLQPQVGTALTATLDEPDRGRTGLTWSWESSLSPSGSWDPITGARSRSYTPVDTPTNNDVGRYLRVTASYSDKHGADKTVRAVSDGTVRTEPVTNTDPEFPSSEKGMRSVVENTAQDTTTGRNVGAPVVATDTDINDVLSYSLGGTHASFFEIDGRSGQLLTKTQLDHESRSSYSVIVTARDPSRASDSIGVTISVTNVEETGTVTFSSEFPRVGQSLAATLADPDGGVSGTVWEWFRSTNRFGGWVLIDVADSRTYSPVDADLDHHLRAIARYTYRHEPQSQDSAEGATLATVSQRTGPVTTTTITTTTGTGGGGGGGGFGGGGGGGGFGGGGGGGGPAPGGADEPSDPAPAGFTDVDATSVHAKNIDALYAAEITTGCGTDPLQFCPGRAVTRAQMASFLARAFDLVEVEQLPAGFVDVDSSSVHAKNIDALFAAGITTGCGTDPLQFCPGRAVTRAQMASFLARAFDLVEVEQLPAGFVDVDSSSVHAKNIDALFAAGITTGCGTDRLQFCPGRAVTRAQMASFLARAFDLVEVEQ